VTEGGIGVSRRVVNEHVRDWVRVLSSENAGGAAVVGYCMTGDLWPDGSVSRCVVCVPRRFLTRGVRSPVWPA
jgi:hypothetical protein